MVVSKYYSIKVDVKTDTKELMDMKRKLVDLMQTAGLKSKEAMDQVKKGIIDMQYGMAAKTEEAMRTRIGKEKKTLLDQQAAYRRDMNQKIAHQKKLVNQQALLVKQASRFRGEWLSALFVIQAVAAPFQEVFGKVMDMGGGLEAFGNIISAVILPFLMPFIVGLLKIGAWIAENKESIGGVLAHIVTFLSLLGGAMVFIVGAILGFPGTIGAVLALVIAFFVSFIAYVISHWKEFVDMLGAFFKFLIDPIKLTIDWIKSLWSILTDDSLTVGEKLQAAFKATIDTVISYFQDLWDFVVKVFDFMTAGLQDTWGAVAGIGGGIWNWLTGKQFGGNIKKSGLYYLHAGEEVISNSPAGNSGGTFNNTFMMTNEISSDIDVELMTRDISKRLGRQLA